MASATDTIELLRRNMEERVCLELSRETNLEELEAALRSNTRGKDFDLFLFHSLEERTQQEFQALMGTISTRPHLQRLSITSEEFTSYSLDVTILSEVLNAATGLTALKLGFVSLSGSINDFVALEESFQNQSSLKQLHCTCWLSESTRLTMTLDPLIKALASSQSLQSIYFHPAFRSGGISSATLGMLCTSPSLQSLNIAKCDLNDENITAMATILEQNVVLTELRLSAKIAEPGSLAIAHCLGANTHLRVLSIHNTNTTIPSDDAHNDEYNSQMAQALKTNRTLEYLALHGVKLSTRSQQSFVEMIRENCTLQDVSLLELEDDFKTEIDMFTLLNRCGRQRLLRNGGVERYRWIDTMAMVADNLDCLYYLLSTKPSLCEVSANDANDDAVSMMKRSQGELDLDSDPSGKRAKAC